MGLISFLGTLAKGAVGLLGAGPLGVGTGVAARTIAAPTIAGGARAVAGAVGRAAVSPLGLGVAGGVAGAALGEAAFGGPGAVAPAGLQAIVEAGGAVTPLSGGRFMAIAPNGDMQVFNRMGMPVRPSIIVPAGSRLPGGATVVSIRQGGALIGLTKRRQRRAFATEVRKVRSTIQGCRAVLAAAEKPRRRSSHG